jgi:hypothetical protein
MRTIRAALVALGLAGIGYGAVGLATQSRPVSVGLFAVVAILGHDLLLAPLALLVAVLTRRLVPADLYPVVRGGLIVTGGVVLAFLPIVLGFGYRTPNPSALPLNYPLGLAVTLAAVWLVTAALAVLRRRRRAGSRRHADGLSQPRPRAKP